MNRWFYIVSSVALVFLACQGPAQSENPVKIIFDTDMGSDCDDVGALALLHHYASAGKAEILGCVYSSGVVPYGAAIIQAINIYYGRPDIPIGAAHDSLVGDPIDKMTAEKLAKDNAAFGNTIVHSREARNQTKLCREILVSQPDQSVTYLTVGHTHGLYDLLTSNPDDISPLSGHELIQQKIKQWVALGALRASNPEQHYTRDWNFFFNGTALYTEYLVKHFPVPIVYVDAGHDVRTGKSLTDTPPGNIVRTAYRDWLWNVFQHTLDHQRPSWDLAAVYYAVNGAGRFLKDTGSGWLEFDAEIGCRWVSDPDRGDQRFIIQKQNIADEFSAYLNTRIAIPPRIR